MGGEHRLGRRTGVSPTNRIPLKNPLRLTTLLFGQGFGRIDPNKVEFAAVEQLPLDFIAGLQADGGGQG